MNEKNINEMSLEESFEMINELIKDMSEKDVPLEESFEKYKLGMQLIKHCSDQIDGVQKQLIELSAADIPE